MPKRWSDLTTTAVAAGVAVLLAACGTSSSAGSNRQSGTKPATALPTPFTITARYSAKSLGIDNPAELAIGPDRNIYLTDSSQRVTAISADGHVLRRWGRPGRGPGEFRFVSSDPKNPKDIHAALAVGADGIVYVSDSGNGRVQLFTARGHYVRQFGSFGAGKGQFLSPFDLAVDDLGNVYVADDQLEILAKYAPSGAFVWQIGGTASPDPDLVGHLHLTSIDAHGRLVMANDDRSRVVYADRNGHAVDAFGSRREFPGGACDATVDSLGYTYVTGCSRDPCAQVACAATRVFDRAHRLVAQWPGTQSPLLRSPTFGPVGEVFALGQDRSVLRLHITLPRR